MGMPSVTSLWRRTFSAFPGGRPGFGLLLLRMTAGAELGWYGLARPIPWPSSTPVAIAAAALALACAASILAGYHTGTSSLFAAGLSIAVVVSGLFTGIDADATRISSGFTAVIAIALALLGPGAFSVDALRYGHREIAIPRTGEVE